MIYLAAPFFSPEQLALVKLIEDAAEDYGLELFSPRKEGVLMGKSREERAAAGPKIFKSNCDNITACYFVLAVVDGRDPGVIWEMGYAYAIGKRIVTYTDQNFGLNVMMRECVTGHVRGMDQLSEFLVDVETGTSMDLIAEKWRYAEPAVT